jgi:hypothetical protein
MQVVVVFDDASEKNNIEQQDIYRGYIYNNNKKKKKTILLGSFQADYDADLRMGIASTAIRSPNVAFLHTHSRRRSPLRIVLPNSDQASCAGGTIPSDHFWSVTLLLTNAKQPPSGLVRSTNFQFCLVFFFWLVWLILS